MSKLMVLGAFVLATFLNGFALKLLWGWFIATTFHLPVLSLPQAMGLGMVIGLMTVQHIPRNEEEKMEMFFFEIVTPVLLTGIGWIVHLFL